MALGSIQPLTEMSTGNISCRGKAGRCVRLTTYHDPVPLSRNLGALTSWNPLDLSRPVMGLIFTTSYRTKHSARCEKLGMLWSQFSSPVLLQKKIGPRTCLVKDRLPINSNMIIFSPPNILLSLPLRVDFLTFCISPSSQ